ncbi:MAG: YbbR-like domain-containing protein [Tannerellaceae bacterium]|nr:YbbR-like domain-containing protein [Tannerellaceae bacterium]
MKDRGSVLLNYSFGRTFASIDVNMKNTSGAAGSLHVRTQDVEYEISKQLISSTQLQSFDPQEIIVEYSQRAHKPVSVEFNGLIYPEDGYALSGDISILPTTIEAYSTQAIIDTLSIVNTVYTEFKNAAKTITRIVQIQPVEGINFEPSMVTVTIPIEEFTEKTFEIPVLFKRVPIDQIVRPFPSTIKINAFVPLSNYKDLTEDDFAIIIDYRELEDNTTGILPISLTKKPAWIQEITLIPDKIEFIFEQIRNQ